MLIRRFLRDRRGASAVEFALIAPILIALYFGIAELSEGMMSGNKVGQVASSIGDLAAQNTCLSDAEVGDVFNIGALLVKPFNSTNLKMRISSLTSNASTGVVKVDWSDVRGMTALATGSTQTVPAGLMTNGQSVILAESSYQFTSPLSSFVPNALTFNRRYYLRPRKSDNVTRQAAAC